LSDAKHSHIGVFILTIKAILAFKKLKKTIYISKVLNLKKFSFELQYTATPSSYCSSTAILFHCSFYLLSVSRPSLTLSFRFPLLSNALCFVLMGLVGLVVVVGLNGCG